MLEQLLKETVKVVVLKPWTYYGFKIKSSNWALQSARISSIHSAAATQFFRKDFTVLANIVRVISHAVLFDKTQNGGVEEEGAKHCLWKVHLNC